MIGGGASMAADATTCVGPRLVASEWKKGAVCRVEAGERGQYNVPKTYLS